MTPEPAILIKDLDFEYENEIIKVDSPAYTLSPVILFIISFFSI